LLKLPISSLTAASLSTQRGVFPSK